MFAQLGMTMSWIALTWLVLRETGSATNIGLVLAAYPVAQMITSPFIGIVLDRWPRKILMLFDNVAQLVLYALIPVVEWFIRIPFLFLLVLFILAGALSPISMIGRSVLVPNLVTDEELEAANALTQVRINLVTLLGPALGGMLIGFIGAPLTFLVTSGCFLVYVVTLIAIPARMYAADLSANPASRGSKPDGTWLTRLGEGWVYLYRVPLLFLLTMITLFFDLTYGPLEPALPVLIAQKFHGQASMLGMMWSSFAVGALLGTLLWGRFRPQWSVRWVTSSIIVCWGLCSGILGLAQSPWLAMASLFLGGFTYAPYNVIYATCQQRLVPDQIRGKVYGATTTMTGAGLPVGYLMGGVMVASLGAPLTVLIGGAACVLLGLGVFLLRRPWNVETAKSEKRTSLPAP